MFEPKEVVVETIRDRVAGLDVHRDGVVEPLDNTIHNPIGRPRITGRDRVRHNATTDGEIERCRPDERLGVTLGDHS